MLLGSLFGEDEFSVVAPSRPRCHAADGRKSPEEQADAMAALIDQWTFPAWQCWQVLWERQAPFSSRCATRKRCGRWRCSSDEASDRESAARTASPGGFAGDFRAWRRHPGDGKGSQQILARFLRRRMKALMPSVTRWRIPSSIPDQLEWFRASSGRSCRRAPERPACATIFSRFGQQPSFLWSRLWRRR